MVSHAGEFGSLHVAHESGREVAHKWAIARFGEDHVAKTLRRIRRAALHVMDHLRKVRISHVVRDRVVYRQVRDGGLDLRGKAGMRLEGLRLVGGILIELFAIRPLYDGRSADLLIELVVNGWRFSFDLLVILGFITEHWFIGGVARREQPARCRCR